MKSDNRDVARDSQVDRLLQRALRAGPLPAASDACLDAETLAAWAGRVLPAGQRAAAEAHAADCARCQAMLAAMARTQPFSAAPEPWWRRRMLGWLVPLTAAATAAGIWIVVSTGGQPRRPAEVAQATAPAPAMAAAPATPPQPGTLEADRMTASPSRLRQLDQDPNVKKRGLKTLASAAPRDERKENARLEKAREPVSNLGAVAADKVSAAPPPPANAPAPARPAAASEMTARQAFRSDAAMLEIVSPDPSSRWRVRMSGAGRVVEHSADGGATWDASSTTVQAEITAGASPSPSVCWLVGRAGTILLSTDGRSWQRLVFPEKTDVKAIRATDAKTATVTTSDGRAFTTKNGGLTWDPAPLQESPAAPF